MPTNVTNGRQVSQSTAEVVQDAIDLCKGRPSVETGIPTLPAGRVSPLLSYGSRVLQVDGVPLSSLIAGRRGIPVFQVNDGNCINRGKKDV